MARRIGASLAAIALLAACSGEVTEIVITVRADDAVVAQIDRVRIEAGRPMGEAQNADADLETQPLPRSLTLVHREGPLGPVDAHVAGLSGEMEIVGRDLRLDFQEGKSLRLIVELAGSCIGMSCGAGSTCDAGACRPVEVGACELEGAGCDAGVDTAPPGDATPDACGMPEACNGMDDDCDGRMDEGFDLMSDADNCGSCGRSCEGSGAHVSGRMCVAGSCELACDPGWADCNREPTDGCEVDTMSDMAHCGACGVFCPEAGTFRATDTVCTGGRCLVSCEADWGDCDMDPSNGCETNLRVEPAHCGACGAACPMSLRCRDFTCE